MTQTHNMPKQTREIRNRWTGAVIHSGETNTIAELAVANRANLRGADLGGADLGEANLSGADLSNDAFPFGTSRLIDLGYSTVRATRITYVGELGWELYVPTEFAVGVYEDLMAAGADACGCALGAHSSATTPPTPR